MDEVIHGSLLTQLHLLKGVANDSDTDAGFRAASSKRGARHFYAIRVPGFKVLLLYDIQIWHECQTDVLAGTQGNRILTVAFTDGVILRHLCSAQGRLSGRSE
jgi:hypothetical protein